MAKYMKTEKGYINIPDFALASFKPSGKSYLTFSSLNNFTLAVYDTTKHWDGTLEYFSSDKTWITWDGTSALSAVADDGEYVLYMRGSGNTVITGSNTNYRWVLTGSNIACIGNIENLLDYITVESGGHPTMANYCYASMFQDCTALIQAPSLPAMRLAYYCYYDMFQGCTALTQAPSLPAMTLADGCYSQMFQDCTALIQAPSLPATTLAQYCYFIMFQGCTSLAKAPSLPATTLSNYCYQGMFQGCTSLIQAPSLPATTLAGYCYQGMFYDCTSLIQAPSLPATTLVYHCYDSMFYNCIALTQVPALPAMTLAASCYDSMLYRCISIKLSSTKTDEYIHEYHIPSSGNGTTATDSLRNMFGYTGGTFTRTPAINTTYYLSSDNMIVRDTDISTLNGYVGSMINNAVPTPDTTLSVAGKSADAKATGDAIHALSQEIAEIPQAPVQSVNGQTGKVNITASDIGALPDTTVIPSIEGLASESYVNSKVAGVVNSAPETLDTLNELAAALGNDENFAATVAMQIGTKVDKIEGKGLSTNDYTTEEKTKLANLIEGAEVNVQSDWNETDTSSDAYIANKPTIPNKTSDLTNDSGFLTSIPDEYITETELTAKGYLTSYTETDPTVPAWAKEATKPTYTAAEVGALPADTVIPSIDGLATEAYVNNAVTGVNAVPSTSTDDNDKILMVVNGVPTWVAITNAEGVEY